MAGEDRKLDDWVLPLDIEFDPNKVSQEKLEKHVKRGLEVTVDPDRRVGKVTGKIVIKGNRREGSDPR